MKPRYIVRTTPTGDTLEVALNTMYPGTEYKLIHVIETKKFFIIIWERQ